MKFKKIKPPKFRIGRNVLNEYELMKVMLEVAEGSRDPEGIVIKDQHGNKATIRPDGRLREPFPTFGTQFKFFMDTLDADRERREHEGAKKGKK